MYVCLASIALLNRSDPDLEARVRRQRIADVGLPAPVAFELYYRAFKSWCQDASVSRLDGMAFEIGPFEASDARAAGAVRADHDRRAGRPARDEPLGGVRRRPGSLLVGLDRRAPRTRSFCGPRRA